MAEKPEEPIAIYARYLLNKKYYLHCVFRLRRNVWCEKLPKLAPFTVVFEIATHISPQLNILYRLVEYP